MKHTIHPRQNSDPAAPLVMLAAACPNKDGKKHNLEVKTKIGYQQDVIQYQYRKGTNTCTFSRSGKQGTVRIEQQYQAFSKFTSMTIDLIFVLIAKIENKEYYLRLGSVPSFGQTAQQVIAGERLVK